MLPGAIETGQRPNPTPINSPVCTKYRFSNSPENSCAESKKNSLHQTTCNLRSDSRIEGQSASSEAMGLLHPGFPLGEEGTCNLLQRPFVPRWPPPRVRVQCDRQWWKSSSLCEPRVLAVGDESETTEIYTNSSGSSWDPNGVPRPEGVQCWAIARLRRSKFSFQEYLASCASGYRSLALWPSPTLSAVELSEASSNSSWSLRGSFLLPRNVVLRSYMCDKNGRAHSQIHLSQICQCCTSCLSEGPSLIEQLPSTRLERSFRLTIRKGSVPTASYEDDSPLTVGTIT